MPRRGPMGPVTFSMATIPHFAGDDALVVKIPLCNPTPEISFKSAI
jgi:hypothetical protein